jgi:hypothetical protein
MYESPISQQFNFANTFFVGKSDTPLGWMKRPTASFIFHARGYLSETSENLFSLIFGIDNCCKTYQ